MEIKFIITVWDQFKKKISQNYQVNDLIILKATTSRLDGQGSKALKSQDVNDKCNFEDSRHKEVEDIRSFTSQ